MINLKRILKTSYFFFLSFIPSIRKNQIFTTMQFEKNDGGPSRFLNNLKKGMSPKGWILTSSSFTSSKVSLIMSNSPGDFFHKRCKAKNIFTVLRVNGFYYPIIFDNSIHKYRDLRILDKRKLSINQRLQTDLLLS